MNSLLKYSIFLGLASLSAPTSGAPFRVQVNSRTLNLFVSVEQLNLPCFMPIEIKSNYNSYSADKSLFGDKWTFNHNIRVSAEGGRFKILESDGFENYYTKEKNLEEAAKNTAEEIIIAQKKEDSKKGGLKSAATYEELKNKLLKDPNLRSELEAKLIGTKPLSSGVYYSFARGPSTLEYKADGTFMRSFQNKSYEVFDKNGLITKSADRNGNFITYAYQDRNLVRINDNCGGNVSFTYQTGKAFEGLVSSIRDSLGREVKYEFYPNRRLKSFKNPQGELVEFTYDKVGNMLTAVTTPPAAPGKKANPEKIEFHYNSLYEVQDQTGPGDTVTKYQRKFVANNNNHSITEISESQGTKPTSRMTREVKIKEFEIETRFDGLGNQVSKLTRKLSPATGYPVSELDEKGQGELFEYDADGNILRREAVPSGQVSEYQYHKLCRLLQTITTKQAGKIVSTASFGYDDRCNPMSAEENQDGKKTVKIGIKWNPQGKISFLTDEINKKEVAFTYWKMGKAESITLKDVGTLLVKYSPSGDILKVDTFAHGSGKERFKTFSQDQAAGLILNDVKSALDSMLGYLRPIGVSIGL